MITSSWKLHRFVLYTGLLKMVVGILTTCHTQYT